MTLRANENDRPNKTIATRILLSFAITLLAFSVTVGFSVVVQRQAAKDSDELAKGFVPMALKLGQLRATQTTLRSLVDGIPDDRNHLSTRLSLQTLASVRSVTFDEARAAMLGDLREHGSPETRELSLALVGELDATRALFADDKIHFDRLFAALEAQDREESNRIVLMLGRSELDADRRLRALTERVATSMDQLSVAAERREQQAIVALAALSLVTIAVGIWVAIHTRKLLAPLAKVTERAKNVAHGDLTPQEIVASGDEIGSLAIAFEQMVAALAREKERALSNERLAAIGKMAAHVTHEIRNPLSSISLNIEMLEEEIAEASLAGESRSLLSAITREVERLNHLSEEYLRVARLPSPRMEAEDVGHAVSEIASFVSEEMNRAGCNVELDIQKDLPPALFDEAQIRQALLNLLRNAREAMPKGGPIHCTVKAEGMSVVIAVADRGNGIAEEIRTRVFDPFFSTKGEGTGLGLAITRQIVEAHGGSLACDQREGGGTVFSISLPIAPRKASLPREDEAPPI